MLLGRAPEAAMVAGLLKGAEDGRSGVLVIRGEAGIGKSALLEEAGTDAVGFTVLRGVGIESESEFAFATLHQILRPVLDRIERLPAPQAAALRGAFALSDEPVEDRFRVSLGVLGLLAEVAEERPVLCLVDDAHWLDRASADALVFAARRLHAEPLVLLFAARDDAQPPFLAPGLAELRLMPLSPTDARTLVGERLGPNAGAQALDWVLANAAGNPLALVELPSTLTPEQRGGQTSIGGTMPPTTTVEQTYLARVRRLPAAAQNLLLIVACEETGDRATITLAAKEVGLRAEELVDAEAAGLVRVLGDRIEFRHPFVRSAVYHAAGFAERERAHRTLAEVLTSPVDRDRRAWHRAATTVGTDDAVADELEAAADRARLRAGHSGSATALVRAAQLSTHLDTRNRRLLAAARAAWHAGQPDRANALLDDARPNLTDPLDRAEHDHIRGDIQHRCGSLVEAGPLLLEGAGFAAGVDTRKALEMLFDAASCGMQSGDYELVAQAGQRAASLPRGLDDEQLFLSDLLVGVGSLWLGGTAAKIPLVRDVVARADAFDQPRLLAGAAMGASTIGDESRELRLLHRAVALARSTAAVDSLTLTLMATAVAGVLGGRFTAAADASEGLRFAREAGLFVAADTHLAVGAWFAAAGGDGAACRLAAEGIAASPCAMHNALATSVATWAQGLLELGIGRPAEAADRLAAMTGLRGGRAHPLILLMSSPDLVEASVRAGRTNQAREARQVLTQFAQPGGPHWALALDARCEALLGNESDAEGHYRNALALHAHTNRPFDQARTELLYGEHLRRGRRRTEARAPLRTALDVFERLRAEPWAERARIELRATGETIRGRDVSAFDKLTPQELQIATLVAEGNSNKDIAARLFLSPRTVEYHLSKVFSKLGISARAELLRHGIPQPRVTSAVLS